MMRFLSHSTGTASVEFAFVAPVLFALTFAGVEFGRVMYSKAEFEYAVYNATRFGIANLGTSTAQIKQSLSNNLILLDPANLLNVTVSEVNNPDKTKTATITAGYRIDFLVPITEDQSITLSKSVSFLRKP